MYKTTIYIAFYMHFLMCIPIILIGLEITNHHRNRNITIIISFLLGMNACFPTTKFLKRVYKWLYFMFILCSISVVYPNYYSIPSWNCNDCFPITFLKWKRNIPIIIALLIGINDFFFNNVLKMGVINDCIFCSFYARYLSYIQQRS